MDATKQLRMGIPVVVRAQEIMATVSGHEFNIFMENPEIRIRHLEMIKKGNKPCVFSESTVLSSN